MSETWKPAIQIWPFKDAPEEFRTLGGEYRGDEELVIFVPKELCTLIEDGDWSLLMPPAISFLQSDLKRKEVMRFASDGFGNFRLFELPDGSRVAITEGALNI